MTFGLGDGNRPLEEGWGGGGWVGLSGLFGWSGLVYSIPWAVGSSGPRFQRVARLLAPLVFDTERVYAILARSPAHAAWLEICFQVWDGVWCTVHGKSPVVIVV
jgi:hypothetical protein